MVRFGWVLVVVLVVGGMVGCGDSSAPATNSGELPPAGAVRWGGQHPPPPPRLP
jgi:hypothetical protein